MATAARVFMRRSMQRVSGCSVGLYSTKAPLGRSSGSSASIAEHGSTAGAATIRLHVPNGFVRIQPNDVPFW